MDTRSSQLHRQDPHLGEIEPRTRAPLQDVSIDNTIYSRYVNRGDDDLEDDAGEVVVQGVSRSDGEQDGGESDSCACDLTGRFDADLSRGGVGSMPITLDDHPQGIVFVSRANVRSFEVKGIIGRVDGHHKIILCIAERGLFFKLWVRSDYGIAELLGDINSLFMRKDAKKWRLFGPAAVGGSDPVSIRGGEVGVAAIAHGLLLYLGPTVDGIAEKNNFAARVNELQYSHGVRRSRNFRPNNWKFFDIIIEAEQVSVNPEAQLRVRVRKTQTIALLAQQVALECASIDSKEVVSIDAQGFHVFRFPVWQIRDEEKGVLDGNFVVAEHIGSRVLYAFPCVPGAVSSVFSQPLISSSIDGNRAQGAKQIEIRLPGVNDGIWANAADFETVTQLGRFASRSEENGQFSFVPSTVAIPEEWSISKAICNFGHHWSLCPFRKAPDSLAVRHEGKETRTEDVGDAASARVSAFWWGQDGIEVDWRMFEPGGPAFMCFRALWFGQDGGETHHVPDLMPWGRFLCLLNTNSEIIRMHASDSWGYGNGTLRVHSRSVSGIAICEHWPAKRVATEIGTSVELFFNNTVSFFFLVVSELRSILALGN